MKTNESTDIAHRALSIANDVEGIVKPRFILKEINIDSLNSDSVVINSIEFNSIILADRLKGHTAVFAFIITSGKEIASYMNYVTDYLDNYILDQIAYMGYLSALKNMQETLGNSFNINRYTSLAPGSLLDWNVEEVKKIFKLIGDDYKKIDVDVMDSGMVNPIKSTSGILFETNDVFHSCEICMKVNCPSREAEYNEKKYNEMINL